MTTLISLTKATDALLRRQLDQKQKAELEAKIPSIPQLTLTFTTAPKILKTKLEKVPPG